jgi:YesN/AraC family two-component response regulator
MTRPKGRSLHILVVDDDASVREALTAALAPEYIVHTVAAGAEACTLLRRQPVAAILLDAVLGDEHGLDLVPRFRELSHAPILVLTGHSNEDLAIRAVWANVDGYLKKPISVHAVCAALDRVLVPGEDASDLAARAKRVLDAYPPRPLRGTELASQLGVTEGHLRRLFRAAYGRTLRQYLAEVRVRRAAELLRTRNRRVKQVALQVGFTNLVVFRRVFKRVIGRLPQAFSARLARTRSRMGKATVSKT